MELSFDFSAKILRTLMTRLHFANMKIIEEILLTEDLSINQFYILEILDQKKETSTTELTNTLKISPPAVTQLVNKLVQLEYVSKSNHPKDKRRNIFTLTQTGQNKIKTLQNKQMSIMKTIIEDMDKGKDLLLIEGLKDFMDSWNQKENYPS